MTENELLTSQDASTPPSRTLSSRWVGITVVTATAVAAGSLGYAFGHTGDTHASAQPAISLTNSGSAGPIADTGTMNGLTPMPPTDSSTGIAMMPYGFGRIIFTSSGLSTDGGTSGAWSYDPGQVFSKQTAVQAANVFGIDEEPTLLNGVWTAGSTDGSGPTMQITPDGLASLNFWDPRIANYGCAIAIPELEGDSSGTVDGSTGSGGGVAPGDPGPAVRDECTDKQGAAVSQAEVIDQFKELMQALGVDPSNYEFESMDSGMVDSGYVTAYEVVGGQRSGASWNASYVGQDLQSMYGALAPMQSLGDYTVVSPSTAVERLGDPRYGMGFSGGPIPYGPMAAEAGVALKGVTDVSPAPLDKPVMLPTPKLPNTVQPGDDFDWPVQEVTVTKARLGVAMYTQTDGATVLLPTYELSGGDEMTWNVVAVDDASLNFSQ